MLRAPRLARPHALRPARRVHGGLLAERTRSQLWPMQPPGGPCDLT